MKWLNKLNAEQAEAVLHDHGPMLILAGAGSGKTTVLVSRTGRLIDEKVVQPDQILVLTFTNKAARELKHRVQEKLGPMGAGIWAGTFHSFGVMMLKKFGKHLGLMAGFSILDQSDSVAVIKDILKDIKLSGKNDFDLDHVLKLINELRANGRFPTQAFDEYHELAHLLKDRYEKKLSVLNAIDFEGLLIKPVELLEKVPEVRQYFQNKFQQIMVDEFQDTNDLQMRLVELLSKEHQNLSVVGDDDQSIYGWRGAQIANILDFPKHHKNCKTVRLEKNYRSSTEIIALANASIKVNKRRHDKVLKAETYFNEATRPEFFQLNTSEEECEFVVDEIRSYLAADTTLSKEKHQKELAILYRSNGQGGELETYLRQNQIQYVVSGGQSFFDRKEIKDTLAYLKTAFFANDVALRRIINTPARGIGDGAIEKINENMLTSKRSFYMSCRNPQEFLPAKTQENISAFMNSLIKLRQDLLGAPELPSVVMLKYLKDQGYKSYLQQTTKDLAGADKKWALIEVFAGILDRNVFRKNRSEETFTDFMESMELRDEPDQEKEGIQLLTVHASKGLEFNKVILMGVEEDLLPHKSLGSDVDEERRLFYVAITRARKSLTLTAAESRTQRGQTKKVTVSRFLLEIPVNLYVAFKGRRPVQGEQKSKLINDFFSQLNSKAPTGRL